MGRETLIVAADAGFCRQEDNGLLDISSGTDSVRFVRRPAFAFPAKTGQRVLLLQGPVGPFFARLRHYLRSRGVEAWQILFNAGDRLFGGYGTGRIVYGKGLQYWERWLTELLRAGQFDCVILFGSDRPAHAVARKVASALEVQVISLEEGYIRPGWITVERDANNSGSPIAGRLPPPSFVADRTARSPAARTVQFPLWVFAAAYYTAATLFSPARQREMLHRPVRVFSEALAWLRNSCRWVRARLSAGAVVEQLLEHHVGQYFIVPLQVSEDSQLRVAGLGWDNARLVRESLKSFAASAPRHMRIVFKIHPLERDRNAHRGLIRELSGELGISDRVDIVEFGSIGYLTRHSAGMITINSTSGLSAIHHGVPLLVIGDALYANPALATCGRGAPDFDAFWTGGHVADVEFRHRYLAWVQHECLRPGDFYTKEGMESACAAVAEEIASQVCIESGIVNAA